MKIDDYRGFEIEVRREKIEHGWECINYRVTRKLDNYILLDDFYVCMWTVYDMIKYIKRYLDNYIEDPESWEGAFGF